MLAEAAVAEGADLVWLAVSAARGPGAVRTLVREQAARLCAVGWRGP
ncbi:MAG: hypothetical protein GWM90_16045, partial [Gemmatimonadetes bacterium]|nr:hypothetical protein [Gemmatimonadota bacterium]NIX45555.1 hypothetical protein [Gemmatimonadota bacterium]